MTIHFQDACNKRFNHLSLNDKIVPACEMFDEANPVLLQYGSGKGIFSLQYFEGVAKLRFSIAVVAELLYTQVERRGSRRYTHEARTLLEKTKQCCINPELNTDDAGPGVFLVKQIFKQFGMAFLTTLTSDRAMEWVIPVHLRRTDEVRSFLCG